VNDTFIQEEREVKILAADDQQIYLEALKMNLEEAG